MESHFRPKFGTVLSALLLVLVFSIAALAQGTGELTGVVNDPTGAVVPNVEVKLTNTATGAVRTTTTSAAGVYRFPALPVVGAYTLTIDAKGFKGIAVKDIAVSVGTTINRDVRLEVGTTNEVVNVEGGVQMVQTTESQVSALVDQRVWQQMPLETRNQNEFINLVAGVVPNTFTNGNRGSAVNGARAGSGNFLVEGADNNDQGQGGRGQISDSQGGAITGISPEAIQEYRVITNSFAAEYGKSGGFVTDTVLKSGTNQYHGSLFEYNRVQALAANNFFSNRSTDPETGKTLKDFVVRNQFGGSFGGALVKDKTFFYASTEIHRRRDKYPTTTTSVTPQFLDFVKSGAFKTWAETDPNGICMQNVGYTTVENGEDVWHGFACPGALSHAGALGPIYSKLMAKGPYPLAQKPWAADVGTNGWSAGGMWAGVYPVPVYGDVTVRDGYSLNENKFSMKFDHRIGNNDQFAAAYMFDDGDQSWKYGGGDNTIGPTQDSPGRAQNLALTWTHTFSPTVLNTAKVSYLRKRSDYPVNKDYEGIPSVYTWADPMGVGFGFSVNEPQFFTDNQFQYQDSISWVRGKHSFKAGGEYRRTRNGSIFGANMNGNFTPWGIEEEATDLYFGDEVDAFAKSIDSAWPEGTQWSSVGSAYQAVASINPITGTRPDYYRGFRANEFAFYIQDDFRVSNRLTLNYGIRWEYFGPPHNFKPGIDSNFYFGTPVTPFAQPQVQVTPASSTVVDGEIVTTPATYKPLNPYFPSYNPIASGVNSGLFMQRDSEIWNKDTNNFGPRFGFAYDVFGNQKFVLRGGAGIMYDRIYNNLFENIRFNAPFFSNAMLGPSLSGGPVGAISTPGLYTDNFDGAHAALFATGFKPLPSPRHMDQNIVSPYYEQMHLGTQWEFLKGYILENEYVGTFGHKLTGYRDINTYNGRMVAGYSSTRINPNLSADNYRSNDYNSNYHALQTTVKKTFSNGLQFNTSYTYSKVLDVISDAFNARGGGTTVTDVWNIKNDYGPADFDIRHRIVSSFTYDLPFMKNNSWIGGWSVNGIVSWNTGVGLSPYSTSDANKDGSGAYDRVAFNGTNPNDLAKLNVTDTSVVWFTNPTGAGRVWAPANWSYKDASGATVRPAWAQCPAGVNGGLFCDIGLGRNSMRGPSFFNTDLGISKKFKISERMNLGFQGNFFNIFNHTQFNLPNVNYGSGNFGKILSTVGSPRVTQLALRLDF